MNHVVQFDPKNLPVTSVHLKMKNNLIPLSFDSHSWNLVIASLDEYQLIINNEIVIPDLSKDFIRKDDKIYSIPTSIKNNLESIKIIDLYCCEHLGYSQSNQKYFPINRTETLNNKNDLINLWCEFENVRFDFILLLEIFSNDTIYDILPVLINKSDSHKNYKRSFFCCFSNEKFIDTRKWTVRARVSNTNFLETGFKFSFIKAQAYQPNIKGGFS
ncbi:hypothetical protein [Cohnella thermotolerans]|uniref:hypothetical protein n=1 Tax=Cohnella thermotolerans TaxID=329858 RepID=UPI0012EBF9CB|nr:hypothetical protein [Cohnella thermotolerans]